MTDLRVAPCSYEAARYAVLRWHYSQAMPSGKLVKFGVWEQGRFIGAVLFGRGASQRLLLPYGLSQVEGCELVRVALREHETPVSQIVAEALRLLRQTNPGLRLVVSFADPSRGHHGGIYQAGNWLYLGLCQEEPIYLVQGRRQHGRANSSLVRQLEQRHRRQHNESRMQYLRRVIDPAASYAREPGKHRYLMPLDRAMRRRIAPLAQPYPHAVEASAVTRPGTAGESRVQLPATAPTAEPAAP